MSKAIIKIDWCSHAAATYAVKNYHYSQRMPSGKLVKFGAWEDGKFIGAVIYGSGATPRIGRPFNINQGQICELVRVALTDHRTPTSKIVAITLKILRKTFDKLKMVVSFADSSQGHIGILYQAGGWLFVGSAEYHAFVVNGVTYHPRTLGARYGVGGQSVQWLQEHVDPSAKRIQSGIKHKYIKVFDRSILDRIKIQPYPKAL